MDKARRIANRMLKDMERRIDEVYATDPSLLRIYRKYVRYMERVETLTKASYQAYQRETNTEHKEELKNVYKRQLKSLTLESKQYNSIVNEFTKILANVNQRALDIVNAEMPDVYTVSYNQVAVDCKKVGIDVDGG